MNKNLEDYVKVYSLLDEAFCKRTIKELEDFEWKKHTFYHYSDGSYLAPSGENECSSAYGESETQKIIMGAIWDAFYSYFWDLDFPWCHGWKSYSGVKFNRYDKQNLMSEHCDHIRDLFEGERRGIPIASAVGLLNNDYEGGEFVMFEDTPIKIKAGEILVFPSCFLFPHRVEPVKEGVRHSFVSWCW